MEKEIINNVQRFKEELNLPLTMFSMFGLSSSIETAILANEVLKMEILK